MYSSILSLTSALDGVCGQHHGPTALHQGKNRYLLHRRLDAPQECSGPARNILPSLAFDPRTVQPIARKHTVTELNSFVLSEVNYDFFGFQNIISVIYLISLFWDISLQVASQTWRILLKAVVIQNQCNLISLNIILFHKFRRGSFIDVPWQPIVTPVGSAEHKREGERICVCA
jgi:hypothetical protein